MTHGDQSAVTRCTQTNALDGLWPMDRVVEHDRSLQGDLDRAPRTILAATAASTRSDWTVPLPPNPPPMNEEISRMFSRGMPRMSARSRVPQFICWIEVQQVSRAPSQRRWWRAAPSSRAPDRARCRSRRLYLRSVKRPLEVSDMRLRGATVLSLRGYRRAFDLRGKIKPTLAARVLDADHRGCRARLLESSSYHDGDGLMVVIHVRRRQHALDVELADSQRARIAISDHRQYARSLLGLTGVDRRDSSLRNPAPRM